MWKYRRFFLISGILMLASELWKQYTLTFPIGGGSYNWWYFPFQLCSIPMYVCLLLPWVHSRRLRQVLTAFLVDFGMLGGIFAFFDTSGMHYGYLPLTVHSFAWHILLILLGLAAALSDRCAAAWKDYAGSVCLYLACCLAATGINLLFDRHGTINMFYINPDYPMTQKVFSDIAAVLGDTAGILIYISATLAGGAVFHLGWRSFALKSIGNPNRSSL